MTRYFARIAIVAIITAGIAVVATMSGRAATDTAIATATIIAPITITQTTDLNFASIVPDTAAQTVTVDGADTRTACSGGLVCTGTVASAAFTVGGGANTGYTIAVTVGDPLTISDGGVNTMSVGSYVFNPTSPATLSGTPPDTLKVGATLSVGASQVAGSYGQVGETFTVEVLYQ